MMNEEYDFIVNGSRGTLEGLESCGDKPLSYHRSLPDYRPGPLRRLRAAEGQLGVRRVWVKDESDRFGLPAFKVLGASGLAGLLEIARRDRKALEDPLWLDRESNQLVISTEGITDPVTYGRIVK